MVRMAASEILPLSTAIDSSFAGRVGIPVLKSQAIYAQFEHVFGVPAEGGVSIDRIQILNTLIDQLSSIKRDRGQRPEPARDFRGMAPELLDARIAGYRDRIESAAAAPATPYRPQPILPQALAFSVFA
jgi:hypothetical protein